MSTITDASERMDPVRAKPPPDPRLAKHNIHDEPKAVVVKVRAITDAHERKFGFRPTPGHVYDVVRANVPTEEIPALYDSLPRSRRHARVRSIPVPSPDTREAMDSPDIMPDIDADGAAIDSLRAAIVDGGDDGYRQWLDQHREFVGDADKELKQRIGLARTQAYKQYASQDLAVKAAKRGHILPSTIVADPKYQERLQTAGIDTSKALGPAFKAFDQIVTGLLLGIPFVAALESKGVYESVRDRSFDPIARTNVDLVKTLVSGIKEDFTNPRENAGYLILDLFGLASLGATGVARAGAKAAGKPYRAGTRTERIGEADVELLNSENVLWRQFQKHRTARANERRAATDDPGFIPDRFRESTTPGRLRNFRERYLSQEAKAGRQLESDRRVEKAIAEMTRKDLERVTGWATRFALTQSLLPRKVRGGLSRGEQMALLVETLDEPGDFLARAELVRDFHERQIQLGLGDPVSHRQRLADLRMAERSFNSGNPRFQQALDLTRKGVAEMEALKREYGLTDEVMQRRVAQAAGVLRGNPVSRSSALSELYWLRKNLSEGKGDVDTIVARMDELRGQLADLPVDLKRTQGKLAGLIEKRATTTDSALAARLDKRIARLTDSLAKTNEALGGIEQLRDESFYFPLQLDSKGRFLPNNLFRGARLGRFGIASRDPSVDLGFNYRFDGKTLQVGEYRIDTTRLVGDQLGKTIRGAFLIREYQNLLKAAHATRRSKWDVPIRTPGNQKVPEKLRGILERDEGAEITAHEAAELSKQDWEITVRELYGAEYRDGRWEIDTKAEAGEFKWVDSRLLGQDAAHAPAASVLQKVGQVINTPFRATTLYLRPAYITNLAGSAAMSLVYQGVFAGPNFVRARLANNIYGKATEEWMRETVGAGRASSYVDERLTSKAERKAASFWNAITDRDLRVSALIYYLRKEGYKKPEDVNALREAYARGDKDAKGIVNQSVQRAKKSMVEFDNLSWFEREYLKHYIFIYPWQRGAAIWNVRTIVERPASSAIIAAFGDEADDYLDEKLGPMVADWFKKIGLFPISFGDDGNPTALNLSGVNTMGTIAGMFARPTDVNAYRELLGPMADIAIGTITGRDKYGQEFDRTGYLWNPLSAVAETVLSLPQVSAAQRQKRADEQDTLPGIDIGDRETLIRRRNAALKQLALDPGWSLNLGGVLEIPGSLVTGGAFTPREANKLAILARAYRDLPWEARRDNEKDLVLTALGMQADALKRSVDPDVKRTVERFYDAETAVEQARRDAGGDITDLGRVRATLDWLSGNDLLTEAAAKSEMAKARKLEPDELSSYRSDLLARTLDPGEALKRWDEDVAALATASNPQALQVRLDRLASDDIAASTSTKGLTTDDLRGYGRTVAEYTRQASDLAAVAQDKTLTEGERVDAELRLKDLEDRYDKPINVAGRSLPSPVRLAWADLPDDDRKRAIASYAKQDWSSLSAFEKELLGKKTVTNAAWGLFEKTLTDYANAQPAGQRSQPQWLKQQAAKYVNRAHDGFYRDWLFAQEPLTRRLEMLKPIQQSPARKTWDRIFSIANKAAQSIKAGYPKTLMRDQWRDYVASNLLPWAQNQPGFQAELDLYGQDILGKLLD